MESISPTCLELIIDWIDSQDIGALWLSGCKRMEANLAQIVKKLDIEFRNWLTISFPTLVSSLPQLNSLRLAPSKSSYIQDMTYGVILPELKGFSWKVLPKNLVSFEINILLPSSEQGALFEIDCDFPCLEALVMTSNRESRQMAAKMPDYAKRMPNLKKLSWADLMVSQLDCDLLPSCLTELSALCNEIKTDDGKINWPPGLTSLSLEVPFKAEWFLALPSSLTDLKLVHPIPSNPLDWSHLTRLQHLSIPEIDFFLPQLPRGLLSLGVLRMLNASTVTSLPSNLTSLSYNFCMALDAKIAAALPRSLTRLLGGNCIENLEELPLLLPPNLQYSAELQNDTELPDTFKDHKGLTSLHLGAYDEDMDFENLPSNLLILQQYPMDSKSLACIPPTVTKLGLLDRCNQDEPWDLTLLPRGLRILEIESEPLPLTSVTGLPSSLTELILSSCEVDDVNTWIEGLPPNLTKLHVGSVEFTDQEFKTPFPSSLVYLNFPFGSGGENAHSSLFRCLPRGLAHLKLVLDDASGQYDEEWDYTGLIDEDLALLPRGLLTANILPSGKLSHKALPLLPPNLISFFASVGSNCIECWRQGEETDEYQELEKEKNDQGHDVEDDEDDGADIGSEDHDGDDNEEGEED